MLPSFRTMAERPLEETIGLTAAERNATAATKETNDTDANARGRKRRRGNERRGGLRKRGNPNTR